MSQIPSMCDAVVTAQDGANYRVYVSLLGGLGAQQPAIPVDVAVQGHCDGVRGSWGPLPAVGTHGRVSFTRNDIRNGVWLGAFRPNLLDSAPHDAANPNIRYTAEYSGAWWWHGQDGTSAWSWPDGTRIMVGPGAFPAPTRHTLDGQGARQTVAFNQAQRVANPPAQAFSVFVEHPTGAAVSISPSGSILVSGVAGQAITLLGDGCSIVMSGGVITLSGAVHALGDVIAGFGTGDQVSQLMHKHLYTPGDNTPTETAPPTAGT